MFLSNNIKRLTRLQFKTVVQIPLKYVLYAVAAVYHVLLIYLIVSYRSRPNLKKYTAFYNDNKHC